MSIRILQRAAIDEAKWDNTIRQSGIGLPYGFTHYLDVVCERWEGIVAGDYEAVMPIPVVRFFFQKRVYQPLFCQQLGVFCDKNNISLMAKMTSFFTENYTAKNYNFNYANPVFETAKNRINIVLALNKSYPIVEKTYNTNTKRNIKKAINEGITISLVKQDIAADFFIKNTAVLDKTFKPKHQKTLQQLMTMDGFTFIGAYSQTILVGFVGYYTMPGRIITIFNSTSAEGKNFGAAHLLFDAVIRQYADTETMLDFEGSSVPSIAKFYRGFGGVEENYRAV